MDCNRLVVAMTGASGSSLALALLRQLRDLPDWETHFVLSHGAEVTIDYELPGQKPEFFALADQVYDLSLIHI